MVVTVVSCVHQMLNTVCCLLNPRPSRRLLLPVGNTVVADDVRDAPKGVAAWGAAGSAAA